MMTEPAGEFIEHQTTRTSVGFFFFSPPAGAPENCKCLLTVQVTVRPLVLPNTAGEKEKFDDCKTLLGHFIQFNY